MPTTLIVSDFGSYIGKTSERLVVKQDGQVVQELPFWRVQEVIIGKRGVSVSTDFLAEAVRHGIHVSFLDPFSEKPYAMISSPHLVATTETRRAQHLAYADARGVTFAKTMVRGKIRNQRALLRYFGKYLRTQDQEKFTRLTKLADTLKTIHRRVGALKGPSIDEIRDRLIGYEGSAGQTYRKGLDLLLRTVEYPKREYAGTDQLVSLLFNYANAILYSKCWGVILNAGLEPFAGFIHTDRPGKPSLVFDFAEEFRQPVVDRTLVALLNRGTKLEVEDGWLTDPTRRMVARKVIEQLNREVMFEGKRYQLKSVLQMQARHLATFFRGERPYACYRLKW